jgi:exopolysaccharide biosynthesis protein
MRRAAILFISLILCVLSTEVSYAKDKQVAYMDAKTGTTFVPLRFVSDYIGAQVSWSAESGIIDIQHDGLTVSIVAGETHAITSERETISLPVPAFADQGITYVPLKLLSAAFGVKLEWQSDTLTVLLSMPDRSIVLPAVQRGALAPNKPAIASYQKTFTVGNKKFPVQMVTVALMDPRIHLEIALAGDEAGQVEELQDIAKRNGAILAINGTFFDAYTDSDYKKPYGFLVNDGKLLVNNSERRATFTFDNNHYAELIAGQDFSQRYQDGNMDGALQAGPRLIVNGKIALDVQAEGFRDPKILTGGGARSALGITKSHELILLTSNGATIPQLAEMMRQAGAHQAMILDGGASSGLYYNGKYLTKPGRLISNAILVKHKPA